MYKRAFLIKIKRYLNCLSLMVVLLVVASCSDDEVLPPSPLPDFDAEIQIEKLWSSDVDDGVEGYYLTLKPAITERWVFAVSYDGEVIKLDRETGDEEWEVDTEHTITGGVAAGYGVVAYGTSDGEAIALSEDDGSVLWTAPLGGQILAVPAISASRVVVQTMDGRLHGLKRESGDRVWVYDTTIPVLTLRGSSSPQLWNDMTLAGFANGKLVAVNTETGLVGWERAVSKPQGRSELERLVDLDGRFWMSGNTVYAATFQGKLAAIAMNSGRMLWQKDFSTFSGVSSLLDQLYIVDEESKISAVDVFSGAPVWSQDALRGRRVSALTPIDNYIVGGDFEGYLHWMSYKDGRFVARTRVDRSGLRAAPVVKDNIVYVQGNSGELAAYQVVEE